MEISEIKAQLPLARVLQYYGLKPDKHLRLHCPFHDDKTPSLQVYYKTHTAYCFSSNCKTHGQSLDVIDFVMHKENCTKHAALETCKQLIGGTTIQPTDEQLTRTAVLTRMFTYFRNAVHSSKPAQAYIQGRALDPGKLEIGYNTGQFHHGTRRDELLIKSCVEVGLLSLHDRPGRTGEEAYRPFAKYCLVFALRNPANQVAGLYFRSTINDSDQRHFYLKDRQGLYPRYPQADTKKLILTESVIDAATLLQIPPITEQYSIIALYGTNGLTEEHLAAIKELSGLDEIIFWLNADAPGEEATKKHAATLQALYPARNITQVYMPAGEDINSLAQTHSDMANAYDPPATSGVPLAIYSYKDSKGETNTRIYATNITERKDGNGKTYYDATGAVSEIKGILPQIPLKEGQSRAIPGIGEIDILKYGTQQGTELYGLNFKVGIKGVNNKVEFNETQVYGEGGPNPIYDGFNYPFYLPADRKILGQNGYNFLTMDLPGINKRAASNGHDQFTSIFYTKKGATWVPKLSLSWGYKVTNGVVKPAVLIMSLLK